MLIDDLNSSSNNQVFTLFNPTDISYNQKIKKIAITHAQTIAFDISIHNINDIGQIDWNNYSTIGAGKCTHGVRFSPNGEYLVYCYLGDAENTFTIYKLDSNENYNVHCIVNYDSLKSKAIQINAKSFEFTKDGKYLLVCYGVHAKFTGVVGSVEEYVAVYELNDGKVKGKEISITSIGICTPETIRFFDNDTKLSVVNQGNDTISFYSFNAGHLSKTPLHILFDNKLSFAHGIAFDTTEKFMLVTNYGDDSVLIYSFLLG